MKLQEIFRNIIANGDFHAKFLNTLPLMENTGIRKISASEHKKSIIAHLGTCL